MNTNVKRRPRKTDQRLRCENLAYRKLLHDLASPFYCVGKCLDDVVAAAALSLSGSESLDVIRGCLQQIDEILQRPIHHGPGWGKLTGVSLQQIVDSAVAGRQAGRPTPLNIRVDGPLPRVTGIYSPLLCAVDNLLKNAVKFVKQGDVPRVRISAVMCGDCVRLRIADRGIGFTPAQRKRLFKPGTRLHPKTYHGSGLGLASVRDQISAIGGRVGAYRRRRRGVSIFWIKLPVHPGQPPGEVSPPDPSAASSTP